MKQSITPDVAAPDTEQDDEPRHAHIVRPARLVAEAYMNGTAVTALCGHTWIPSRNPQSFPLCPRCKTINERVETGLGGSN